MNDKHEESGSEESSASIAYRSEKGIYRITMEKALNSWAVTVYESVIREGKRREKVIIDDYFDKRWEAIARAEDFLRLCNRKEVLAEKEGEAGKHH